MNLHRLGLMSLIAATLLTFVGCAGAGSAPRGRDGSTLEYLGDQDRYVAPESTETFEVQYLKKDGSPWIDVDVAFYIDGPGGGARITRRLVRTDADGIATTTLRTASESVFEVVAEADGLVASALVEVGAFDLEFSVRNPTSALADSAQVGLFIGLNCGSLMTAPSVPMPDMHQTVSIGQQGRFKDVPAEPEEQVALLAVGIDRYFNAVAEGCTDLRGGRSGGESVRADIVLNELTEQFGGEYDVETELDITLNPYVNILLAVTAGVSSNPAAYLLDLVSDYETAPTWLIEALTTTVTRAVIESFLRDAIDGVIDYSYVQAMGDAGVDLHMALSHFTLVGQLSFSEPSMYGESRGQHRVQMVRLPLLDRVEERNVVASSILDIYVDPITDDLDIGEHTLRINFGTMIREIWQDIVLARLPGSPRSSIQFVQKSFDCGAILARLNLLEPDTLTYNAVDTACDIGVTMLAVMLEDALSNLSQYDEVRLYGDGDLVDTDADGDRDLITHSDMSATWLSTAGTELYSDGEMRGLRHDDRVGRDHPLIVRINGIR